MATRARTQSGETAAESTDEPEVVPELPAPTNVIQAIARVMAEIGGIEKLTPQQRRARGMSGGDAEGIKYAYRGIDQLAQHAQPLFGKYGVVIVPNVVDVEIDKIVKGSSTMENTQWTRTTVTVEWTLYGPSEFPTENDFITSKVIGVGDDNSDKGMNKAMTAAFKNLLLRILCIGDPQDDADGRDENQPMEYRDPAPEQPFGKTLFDQIKASDDDKLKALLRQFALDKGKRLTEKVLVEDEPFAREVYEAIVRYGYDQEPAADEPSPAEPPADNVTPIGGAAKRGSKKADEVTEQVAAQLSEQLGATDVSEETKTDG